MKSIEWLLTYDCEWVTAKAFCATVLIGTKHNFTIGLLSMLESGNFMVAVRMSLSFQG